MAERSPGAKRLANLVSQGKAMPAPGQDRPGRFPIQDETDLKRAIQAVGRAGNGDDNEQRKVRRFIIKRATALNLSRLIPDNWAADGSLKSPAE